jgi:hypothetical protein
MRSRLPLPLPMACPRSPSRTSAFRSTQPTDPYLEMLHVTDAPQAVMGARHRSIDARQSRPSLRAAARARGPAGHRGDQHQLYHAGRDPCPHGIRTESSCSIRAHFA